MIKITIDGRTKKGKKLIEFLETLNYVKVEKKVRVKKVKGTESENNS